MLKALSSTYKAFELPGVTSIDQPEVPAAPVRAEREGMRHHQLQQRQWQVDQPVLGGGVHQNLVEHILVTGTGDHQGTARNHITTGESLHGHHPQPGKPARDVTRSTRDADTIAGRPSRQTRGPTAIGSTPNRGSLRSAPDIIRRPWFPTFVQGNHPCPVNHTMSIGSASRPPGPHRSPSTPDHRPPTPAAVVGGARPGWGTLVGSNVPAHGLVRDPLMANHLVR